jgi:predicted transcriptional regulator
MTDAPKPDLLGLTAEIVTSHVSNNAVSTADLPGLIENVYASLARASAPAAPTTTRQEPAVSVRASVKPDYLVCLEDGKQVRMLKRYLMHRYGMTPADYRAKWGLPADYPMVAPNVAAKRRQVAINSGLGRKPQVEQSRDAAEPKKTGGRRKLGIAVSTE